MTPIVSPWLVYLAGVSMSVRIVLAMSSIVVFAYPFFKWMNDDPMGIPLDKKLVKRNIIIGCIVLGLGLLTPSRETIAAMVVAQNVTYERVESAGNIVEDVYSDVIQLLIDKTERER